MIGLDTNILVRYLTQDHKRQCDLVNAFIESSANESKKLIVNLMVLLELVWVLEDCYHYKKSEITQTLRSISEVDVLEIEGRETLLEALHDFQKHAVDLSDCLIGRFNQMNKCSHTVTFDKQACKLETFQSLQ